MIPIGTIIAWFGTSKLGRMIAAGFALAFAVGIAVLKVFSAGKASERQKQDQQSLENLRERARNDDEISTLPTDQLDSRLSRWVSPDDKEGR